MKGFFSDVIVPGGIIFAVFGLAFGSVAAVLDRALCNSRAAKMELSRSWGPLHGCMVSVDGKWMPIESYKVIRLRP